MGGLGHGPGHGLLIDELLRAAVEVVPGATARAMASSPGGADMEARRIACWAGSQVLGLPERPLALAMGYEDQAGLLIIVGRIRREGPPDAGFFARCQRAAETARVRAEETRARAELARRGERYCSACGRQDRVGGGPMCWDCREAQLVRCGATGPGRVRGRKDASVPTRNLNAGMGSSGHVTFGEPALRALDSIERERQVRLGLDPHPGLGRGTPRAMLPERGEPTAKGRGQGGMGVRGARRRGMG